MAWGREGKSVVWVANKGLGWRMQTGHVFDADALDKFGEIEVLTLGVDMAYVVVATNGKMWWHLKGNYPALQAIIVDLQSGDVRFVALNPYRVGEFFLLFANDTAVFQVPHSYRDKLERVLSKHGIRCLALTSQEAHRHAGVPRSARDGSFVKGLLKSVAGNVAGGVISGVASALVGAAACNVM